MRSAIEEAGGMLHPSKACQRPMDSPKVSLGHDLLLEIFDFQDFSFLKSIPANLHLSFLLRKSMKKWPDVLIGMIVEKHGLSIGAIRLYSL